MIIGASVTTTPYKIRTLRAEHYLRCGADILLNGIQMDIEGEARCVVCGDVTSLKMSEGAIRTVDPSTAVLHVVEIPRESGRPSILCEASPLFDKENCLRVWLESYDGRKGLVLKPQEFLDRMVRMMSNVGPN